MDNPVDPTGRLAAGMQFRFKLEDGVAGRIEGFCSPCGLYRRPVTDADRSGANGAACKFIAEYVDNGELQSGVPCEGDHPDAVFHPELLMASICYTTGGRTTVHAVDIEEVK